MTSEIPCKYFPQLPARWHCHPCQVNMSDPCAIEAEPYRAKSGAKLCPICNRALYSIGIGNSIKPFWQRIPKFFLYPIKPNALVYLATIACINVAGVIHPIVVLLLYLLSMVAVLNYCFKCLNHSARGNLEPPSNHLEYPAAGNDLVLKQIGVYVIMGLIVSLSALMGKPGFYSALIFLLAGIPGSTMLLAMEGRVLSAINPVKLFNIMLATGKSYWILYVFLILLSGGEKLLPEWVNNVLPSAAILPVQVFLTGYFMVVMYAMMGYLIYQHHEELGFDEVKEFKERRIGNIPGLEDNPFLNTITILIKEGKPDEALKRLKPRLQNGGSLKEHEKYHKLLVSTENKEEINEHGKLYIRRLLGQEGKSRNQKLHEVLEVYADCLKNDSAFHYPEAKVVYELAKAARQFNMHNLAMSILKKFHMNYAYNRLIPDAYLMLAQMLVEHRQKDEEAKKLLRFVIKRYPEHELAPQIKDYLTMLGHLPVTNSASYIGSS